METKMLLKFLCLGILTVIIPCFLIVTTFLRGDEGSVPKEDFEALQEAYDELHSEHEIFKEGYTELQTEHSRAVEKIEYLKHELESE